MSRVLMYSLAAIILLGSALAGPVSRPAAAAVDVGYRQADHALTDALAKGDRQTVATLLV